LKGKKRWFFDRSAVGIVVATGCLLSYTITYEDLQAVHELSMAENIVGIIRQSVPSDELADVRIVRMKIGALSGVVADSLSFCFTAISSDTPLAKARLEIEQLPFAVHCNSCGKTFENDIGYVVCPECDGVETTVVSGRELQVTEIELEDEKESIP
jgi:hydrogenase nickel incorporation protein HypA/HybF